MTLQARNLTVSIGGKIICRELDLTLNPGECWAVLGQNGAGKTTLLRTMAGLHAPDAGEVQFRQLPLGSHARRELARNIGVLQQHEGGEFWGSVLEYVLLGRFPYRTALFGYSAGDEAIAMDALAQMELDGLASRPLNTLSGGEHQRAAIAQLLAQQPRFCLLDEPLQHLDLRHQLRVMHTFRRLGQQGAAVLLVLHDLIWIQDHFDHLLLIFPDGSVRCGAAEALLTRANLEALYQCTLLEQTIDGKRCFIPSV
jgi:iron complex transport system ATP-binding protein